MKKIFASVCVVGMMLTAILSCDDESSNPKKSDLSDAAKSYISMYLGGGSRLSASSNFGPGNPMAESFQRLAAGRSNSGGRLAGDSIDTSEPDTVVYDDYTWITCATVTTEENEDGSVTTTYDYGDGCWEGSDLYRYFMFGKYSFTSNYTRTVQGTLITDSYLYDSEMDNYGGTYYYEDAAYTWSSDGISRSSGASSYDSIENTYNGYFDYEYDNTYTSDSLVYANVGSGRTSYDNLRYVVERNDYSFEDGGNFYKVSVLEPLIYEYNCNPYKDGMGIQYRCFMIIYTYGKEKISYKQDGEEGSFIIDYGNGTCDSKITITENGKSVVVDMFQPFGD